ncbi:MAG: phosphate ABC transporter substrate-binding protein [Candidatus Hydrogenedentes bacterium]|nr:phosphate ABC transporter substrate-binding protein [Candidatus Hydrogenedentota bacterium]
MTPTNATNKPFARLATAAALAVFLTLGSRAALAEKAGKSNVTVKGSDTLVQLSAHWAEEFMKKYPDASVAVTGGGSGIGISALLNGTTDICNASRDIKPEEKKKAAENGITPIETNVALDGIAIVVNKDNPLTEISLEQLKQIFTGEATEWDQFGGPKGKIIVLTRETSSGTYVFFQELVLGKKDYATSVRMMPTTSAIIEAVATDKTAIGYVGLGYAAGAKDRVKVLKVRKDANTPAIEATEETVRSSQYPIARPLHCYTNGKPNGAAGKFIEFCLSPEGQTIVREEGFVPLK